MTISIQNSFINFLNKQCLNEVSISDSNVNCWYHSILWTYGQHPVCVIKISNLKIASRQTHAHTNPTSLWPASFCTGQPVWRPTTPKLIPIPLSLTSIRFSDSEVRRGRRPLGPVIIAVALAIEWPNPSSTDQKKRKCMKEGRLRDVTESIFIFPIEDTVCLVWHFYSWITSVTTVQT